MPQCDSVYTRGGVAQWAACVVSGNQTHQGGSKLPACMVLMSRGVYVQCGVYVQSVCCIKISVHMWQEDVARL